MATDLAPEFGRENVYQLTRETSDSARYALPPKLGGRYIGAGEFVTMTQIAEILRRELGADGAKVATRGLPDWLIRLVGLFDPEVGGQTFELGKERRLSSAKARDELGWTTRPVAQTIVDTAASLARTGALA